MTVLLLSVRQPVISAAVILFIATTIVDFGSPPSVLLATALLASGFTASGTSVDINAVPLAKATWQLSKQPITPTTCALTTNVIDGIASYYVAHLSAYSRPVAVHACMKAHYCEPHIEQLIRTTLVIPLLQESLPITSRLLEENNLRQATLQWVAANRQMPITILFGNILEQGTLPLEQISADPVVLEALIRNCWSD